MARLNIPESKRIRRLAAGLATVGKSNGDGVGLVSLDRSVGLFFREFPWEIRRKRKPGKLPAIDLATVGQYFSRFDWEAIPRPSAEQITEVDDSHSRVSQSPVIELFPS